MSIPDDHIADLSARLEQARVAVLAPWRINAACRDAGIDFFDPAYEHEAVELCQCCPVRLSCIATALACEEVDVEGGRHGVYGGLTGDERDKLTSRHAALAPRVADDRPAARVASLIDSDMPRSLAVTVVATDLGVSTRTVYRMLRRDEAA